MKIKIVLVTFVCANFLGTAQASIADFSYQKMRLWCAKAISRASSPQSVAFPTPARNEKAPTPTADQWIDQNFAHSPLPLRASDRADLKKLLENPIFKDLRDFEIVHSIVGDKDPTAFLVRHGGSALDHDPGHFKRRLITFKPNPDQAYLPANFKNLATAWFELASNRHPELLDALRSAMVESEQFDSSNFTAIATAKKAITSAALKNYFVNSINKFYFDNSALRASNPQLTSILSQYFGEP